jgi:uncharacterized protein (TIGR02757 family)
MPTTKAAAPATTPPFDPAGRRLRDHLDRLHAAFDARHLTPDPLEIVRRFLHAPADAEIVGFLAAGLAYGRVTQILASTENLLDRFGTSPAVFIRDFEPKRDATRLRGWYHRFHGPRDMTLLLAILSRALREHGTLEAAFAAGDDPAAPDIAPGLAAFCAARLATPDLPAGPGVRAGRLAPRAPVRYFFASPADGSACKRLNLWLRWMVRPADGLDLGAWRSVNPARLVIPLDTHVARIARYVGLTDRKAADWRTARDITTRLARFDPADPVKYDFAICRLGILDRCPKRRDPVRCAACLLAPVCTL